MRKKMTTFNKNFRQHLIVAMNQIKSMRNIPLFFLFISFGCNQSNRNAKYNALLSSVDTSNTIVSKNISIVPDTSNQNIYDFMKIMVNDQKLNLNYGLSIEPEFGCDLSGDDISFLNTLLIEPEKQEIKADTGDWQNITITNSSFELKKCLTPADIKSMLEQKRILPTFKWNNSRLGFDMANNKNWYCFSIPLFSKDKKKVVMMVRDLCQGLCGTGRTILFVKENSKWVSQTGGQWIH
ncbi:MAG: hypothetical protein IPK31_06560 [Chitinophagaceae bacterium]|nr:hypothetical protein [Chitinophagaceae bacterium]